MDPITYYYDSTCPICRKRAEYYQRFDKKEHVHWQDTSENKEGLEERMTNERMARLQHVRDRKGKIRIGINAYNALWSELSSYFILAFFTKLRSVHVFYVLIHAIERRLHWHLTKHGRFHKPPSGN